MIPCRVKPQGDRLYWSKGRPPPTWSRWCAWFCKALLGIFLCIFVSLTCLKKPVSSKRDLLRWKVTARLYRDLLTSGLPAYQPWAQISNHGRASVLRSQALLLYGIYEWWVSRVAIGSGFRFPIKVWVREWCSKMASNKLGVLHSYTHSRLD
jgi:hypothetical protein